MAQQFQILKPQTLNLDKSQKDLKETEAFYLLNFQNFVTKNQRKSGNIAKGNQLPANRPACEMEHPLGESYAVGKYFSERTNELYSWVFNSNGVHWIQRINSSGDCEIVYNGDCPIPLSADPKHSIEQFRAYLQVDKICANRHGKSLIWVNGDSVIGMLDVEASIATNSFRTPFFQRCADPCNFIQMCVPDPCGCLKAEWVPLTDNDKGQKNNNLDVGIQISYRFHYYDFRESIWADPSTTYYQNTKGCFDETDGLPRCLKVRVPIGNPLVEKIEMGYKKNGIWYSTEIIEKYKKYNSSQEMWYERDLAELTNYSDEDCSFDWFFCDDKQCNAIDPTNFSREFNPTPQKPQFILPIGIGQDRTALGFGNYETGFCPIDQTQIEKWKVDISCPAENCNPEYTTIKVRAIIINLEYYTNQFIYRLLGGDSSAPDDPTDTAYFGGVNRVASGDLELGYGQQFREKTRNFIVYSEGTDSWSEMVQWKAHANYTQLEKWGTIGNMGDSDGSTKRRWRRAIRNGEFFYQEAEIKVIKGTRGFLRLTSHNSTGNEQNKSTFVVGIMSDIKLYSGDMNPSSITDFDTEEIYFDTCGLNELDIQSAFVIKDNAVDAGGAEKASAYNGYVVDKNGKPVEGAIVKNAALGFGSSTTDFNGFYHFYLKPGTDDAINIDVNVEQSCGDFSTIKTVSVQGEKGANTGFDITIDNADYITTSYANVKIFVGDCDGSPVAGVRVALSGTKYDVTNAEGFAIWKIRNYASRDRELRVVVLNNKGCFSTDCNGVCNPCMHTATSGTTACYRPPPTITFPPATINRAYSLLSDKGLKAGGRYPFAFYVRFDCGQISAAYETNYLDIPKTQQKNKEGFCSFSFDATGFVAPPGAKCVNIVRGANVNPFELQWVVDKITKKDGKIVLTIQSLNDYNAQYDFKTNTVYQWQKNDRVEFIKNGDGVIFDSLTYGLLNYLTISPFHDELISGETDPPANFFNQLIIDDDGKLDGLKEGAVIELQRVKDCVTAPVYYSICVSIPVKEDGTLLYETGVFDTFDTFMVGRNIGKLPTQKFEHKFPSDFWGELIDGLGLSDLGRAYFVNKFENKRRFGRNISINAPLVFNYFGDLVRILQNDGHGDLVAANLTDNQILLAVSEFDSSLHQVGNDFLKVGTDNIVRAMNPNQIISDGQPKVSGAYGCQYPHIGSVQFGDGWATWWDVNQGDYIKHDYSAAKPVSVGKTQLHFRVRGQEMELFNKTATNDLDKYRISTGYNIGDGTVMITLKQLRNGGINNEVKPFQKPNDTLIFYPDAEEFLGYVSHTPEAYGNYNLFDGQGCSFVSFLGGIPYIHPVFSDVYNRFYDTPVDQIVGITLNAFPQKIKLPLAAEIQSDARWYCPEIVTDNPGFLSEVPPAKVIQDGRKWNFSFLYDKNSRGGLYNRDPNQIGADCRGYFCSLTMMRDNTDALKVGTIDPAKQIKISQLDLIIIKYVFCEESGMTENL